MYTTSAAFKTAMAQPSRELTVRGTITFPDATTHALTPTEISKFTITENAGDHLPLGGVSASTLTLILDNRLGEWEPGGSILGTKSLDGAIVELEIGVNSSGYEYANAGVFVIEKPVSQEQDAIITLKGSDYLANRALRAFSDTLAYPQTVLQIVTEACLQANITLKTTVFVNSAVSIPEKPVWDEDTTCRDVISYVACLAGGFARIDRNGELEIISFANQAEGLYSQLLDSSFAIVDGELIWTHPAGYTGPAVTLVGSDLFIDEENIARLNDGEFQFIGTFDGTNYYVHPNRYMKLTSQGVMFGAFNALSVYEHGAPNDYGATRIADDIDIADNELNSVAVRGNPLLAYGGTALTTLMTNMLTSMSGLEYYAASIEWQGDPSITCGDVVTISNLKGEAYNILITNQTLTFGPGFSMVTGNRLNTAVVGKAKVENLRVFTPTGKLNAAALDGDINIRAGRQLNLLSDGALIVKSGADLNIESGGKINIASANGIVLSSGAGIDSALGGKLGTNDPAAGVQTSKITIDSDNINIASGGALNLSSGAGLTINSGGTFTVYSSNFTIDASGNVTLKGRVEASSGHIGDFSLVSGEMKYESSSEDNYTYIGKYGVKLGALYGSTGLRKFEALSHFHSIYGHLFTTNAIIGVAEFDMSQFIIKSGTIGSRVPTIKMTASNGWIQTKGSISIEGNFDCPSGVVVAGDWVDFTPGYRGKSAVNELKGVKNDEKGDIDHSTLPLSARRKVKIHKMSDAIVAQGKSVETAEEEVDGRSIGTMVSILTRAVQELDARIDALEKV